jgi:hypothetical protein
VNYSVFPDVKELQPFALRRRRIRRTRLLLAGGAVLAALPLAAAAPAIAASAGHAAAGPARAMTVSRMAGPADSTPSARLALANWAGAPRSARFIYDELGTDSCTNLSNGSLSHYTCIADGFFAAARTIQPLALTWNQGRSWSGLGTVPDAPSKNLVNLPNEVSCVAPDSLRPTCMMVGEHYKNVLRLVQESVPSSS